MAYPQVGSVPAKLSFAKIAAMPAPNMARAVSNTPREAKGHPSHSAVVQPQPSELKTKASAMLSTVEPIPSSIQQPRDDIDKVVGSIEGLDLVKDQAKAAQVSRSAESGDSFEEDQSQFSNSSLNKPQSFDTKSMASVTTFAMDEKESIRPDDSASVRAVEEDDPPLGLSTNSSFQHEAEAASNTPRVTRPVPANANIAARRYPTLTNPPRFGNLPISPVIEAQDPSSQRPGPTPVLQQEEPHVRIPTLAVIPDEKLLDALATVKDRLPLLQLEEKLLTFVAQSEEDMLELPPQNSFNRLLTHKLADYYSLAHHISEDSNSIRIFRTSCFALPTSLAQLALSIPVGPMQAPGATTMKIMRRAQLGARHSSAGGSTAASSSAPSKATSENGGETNSDEGFLMSPTEGTPGRDKSKLTREEREANYKAARERIFGDFQESVTSESASTGENSASMSRSSSASGKKKPRKHKQPKDDSFEARSAFIPSYAPVQMQYGPSYGEISYPGNYASSPSGYPPNMYGATPTQSYPGFDSGMPFASPHGYAMTGQQQYGGGDWPNMQQPQQGSYYGYQQPSLYPQQSPIMPPMNLQYMQQPGQSMQQSQNWIQSRYQNGFQPGPPQGNQNMSQWSNYGAQSNMRGNAPAYQYGQLPPQGYGAGNFQHPVPGSYTGSKSLFNPQTRSFVPNNTASRAGGRNSRKKSNGKNGSTSGTGTPITPSSTSSPKPKEDSLQQKYGTPANLPKKPPPSQVPSVFDVENISSTPAQDLSKSGSGGPLVVNGTSGAVA